jgi:hypothetical protein
MKTKGKSALETAVRTALVIGTVAVTSLPLAHRAQEVTPPAVPNDLHVPEGNVAFLIGHATGTQNYSCTVSGTGVAWTLFTPQATLFDDQDTQLTTHFFSPNPSENDTIRATWQHSDDTSIVWGKVIAPSTDAAFVAPGAIPWLLIQQAGVEDGPTGDALSRTTYIQRVNTSGGTAPATGCEKPRDIGKKVFVPYTADYVFWTNG